MWTHIILYIVLLTQHNGDDDTLRLAVLVVDSSSEAFKTIEYVWIGPSYHSQDFAFGDVTFRLAKGDNRFIRNVDNPFTKL